MDIIRRWLTDTALSLSDSSWRAFVEVGLAIALPLALHLCATRRGVIWWFFFPWRRCLYCGRLYFMLGCIRARSAVSVAQVGKSKV